MSTPEKLSPTQHREVIAKMLKNARFCMLTYVSESGNLHACPMTPQEQDSDGSIWFLGSKSSDVVQAIAKDARINLSISPDDKDFVSFCGQVELLHNEAKIDALWSPAYNAFYEHGRQDPDIQLMVFRPHGARYWAGEGTLSTLFKLAKSAVGGQTSPMGQSHAVSYGAV